jgi:hypothetical protein
MSIFTKFNSCILWMYADKFIFTTTIETSTHRNFLPSFQPRPCSTKYTSLFKLMCRKYISLIIGQMFQHFCCVLRIFVGVWTVHCDWVQPTPVFCRSPQWPWCPPTANVEQISVAAWRDTCSVITKQNHAECRKVHELTLSMTMVFGLVLRKMNQWCMAIFKCVCAYNLMTRWPVLIVGLGKGQTLS